MNNAEFDEYSKDWDTPDDWLWQLFILMLVLALKKKINGDHNL